MTEKRKHRGRPRIYTDKYHKLWRYEQMKRLEEVYEIMKNHNCTLSEAWKIRRKLVAKRAQRKAKEKLDARLKEAEEYYKRKEKEK